MFHQIHKFLYFLFSLRPSYSLVRPAKWRNQGGQSHKSQEIKISTTFSPEKFAPPPRSFCSVREVKSGEELDDLILFSLSLYIFASSSSWFHNFPGRALWVNLISESLIHLFRISPVTPLQPPRAGKVCSTSQVPVMKQTHWGGG